MRASGGNGNPDMQLIINSSSHLTLDHLWIGGFRTPLKILKSIRNDWASLSRSLDPPMPSTAYLIRNLPLEFDPKFMIVDKERLRNAKESSLVYFSLVTLAAGCWYSLG